MRFRNSFRILMNNFGNVYKLLLFRFITGALFLSIAYAIISLGLRVIFDSAQAQRIVLLAGDFFQALISGNTEFLIGFQETFTEAVTDFFVLIGTNMGSIVGAFIGVCAVYLASRFLNGTASFAMSSMLNDKLEFYGTTPFFSAYFRNLGKASIHQLIYVPLTFVYDVLALAACWFFFFYTPSFLPTLGFFTILLGLALSMTAFVCLQALKETFLSSWVPSVVTGDKRVGAGFTASFRHKKGFGRRFSSFLMAVYLLIVLNVLFGICTFGSMLLVSIPASNMFILCMQLVFYYEDCGKKYFISFRKISGADGLPESMGD